MGRTYSCEKTICIPAPSAPDMEKLQRLLTKYEIEFVELP
jgi:hypothetical protein